ncbi:sigma-54-dependent Fis family transcriptional regulator [bacterium]|nr:MAG: sigma-54-dependent Fis family transcriptional regulator [bacterium]RKZ15451.1 MAG: sigma-54-dependent Fis family transcriptional regulator [bacterium]
MAEGKILIVDDEESMCQFLSIMLKREGYDVTAVNTGAEALKQMQKEPADAVITDIQMPKMDGLQVLAGIKAVDPAVPVIIMTAYASKQTAIEAVNRGAFHYLDKHAKNDEIKMVVRNALEVKQVKTENSTLKRALSGKHQTSKRPIIGHAECMHAVFRMVERVATADSTILIYGESGTGKELIARAIHTQSHRSGGPFVSINCGALPESLLESELFGHVKGSFTGAVRDKDGLFKVANGGTFLLDEIGETTPAIQVKLLRVLQEREIIPVGGTHPLKVDVRIVAATNRDLEEEVALGNFRADLFYRLNVIPLSLPPLRDRTDDVPLLVDHFLNRYSPEYAQGALSTGICDEALDVLGGYAWPGNVRELENVIERAVILREATVIDVGDLPARLVAAVRGGSSEGIGASGITLEELERRYMLQVLDESGWHKKKAAEVLGINPSTLYRKIKSFGLVAPDGMLEDDELGLEEELEV